VTDVLDAAWYDVAMTEPDAPAMLPLEESPWLAMYEALATMIEPHEEVVDLGCGTGRLIELLYRQGHYARITGVDWSAAALAEAQSYAKPGDDRTVQNLRVDSPSWLLSDLVDWKPDPERAGNTVYVCSEVLEHLNDDLDLVCRLPPGHRFLFTVPNFDSEAHIRTFIGVGDVWERYAGLVMFRSWRMVGTERHGIHVAETVRRSDAW
jgi:trans-aconitate methyltransferase